MNRFYKYTSVLLLGALLFTTNDSAAQTGSSVPAYHQEQNKWCWAACGAMIFWAYKPGTVPQCYFVGVSRHLEHYNPATSCNQISNSSAGPCNSPAIFNQGQYLYNCAGSLQSSLAHCGIASTPYNYAFSASQVASATHARKHIVAQWNWNGGGAHVVVVYRYSGGNVSFNDPWYGSSYTWKYSTFKTANKKGVWAHTLRMNSSATKGAVYASKKIPAITTGAAPVLNFYPNPTTDRLNCMIDNPAENGSDLVIYNVMGQVQYSKKLDAGTTSLVIDVSAWSKGTYIVQLNGAAGKKLTVQ